MLRSLGASLFWLAATAVAGAQGLPPPPAGGASQNPVCTRLEAQLASFDRGSADPARADQIRRYEEAASKQQGELDRLVAQSRRLSCEGGGLFSIFTQRPEQCGPLTQQIQQMRGNLDRILSDLERLRGGSTDQANQRRTVLVALAQNNCGPQYRAMVQQPQQSGGFLSSLFGGNSSAGGDPGASAGEGAPGDVAPSALPSGSFRTVCVRTCDGYFFPISSSTNQSRFADDERSCQRLCPASEVILFSHRTGEEINQAVSITGQNYTQLPNAFKYRQTFNKECSCRKPGQSWAEALEGRDGTVERGDIVVTEERAKQLSQPQQQRQQQGQGQRPRNGAAPATPAAAGGSPQPTAADNPTGTDNAKKQVRTVGPTFIPAR